MHFADVAQNLARDLKAVKAKDALRARFSPRALAEYLTAVMQRAIILAKARQDRSVIGVSLLYYREYLKSLFN